MLVMHLCEQLRQCADRVEHRSAIEAGMQVAAGGGDGELGKGETAQEGSDGRRAGVPHARVADEREICLELIGMALEKRRKRRAARFLLPQAAPLRSPAA